MSTGRWPKVRLAVALVGAVGVAATGCRPRSVADVSAPDPSEASPVGGAETGWFPSACRSGGDGSAIDADRDGLADGCELALARVFAPELVVEAGGCDWDGGAAPPRPRGGYLFAVRPTAAGVRIAYLPAYARDCGWSGPKCALLGGVCEGHTGDSEVIAVDVEPVAGSVWATRAVFLSAHCFGDGSCRWYAADGLAAFDWVNDRTGGAPVVWVAAGSHANYPSRDRCDAGHYLLDTCDRNGTRFRFPVASAARNVGSAERPFMGRLPSGCGTRSQLSLEPSDAPPGDSTVECFWTDRPFRGWTRPARGEPPTPYVVYLRDLLGF